MPSTSSLFVWTAAAVVAAVHLQISKALLSASLSCELNLLCGCKALCSFLSLPYTARMESAMLMSMLPGIAQSLFCRNTAAVLTMSTSLDWGCRGRAGAWKGCGNYRCLPKGEMAMRQWRCHTGHGAFG